MRTGWNVNMSFANGRLAESNLCLASDNDFCTVTTWDGVSAWYSRYHVIIAGEFWMTLVIEDLQVTNPSNTFFKKRVCEPWSLHNVAVHAPDVCQDGACVVGARHVFGSLATTSSCCHHGEVPIEQAMACANAANITIRALSA